MNFMISTEAEIKPGVAGGDAVTNRTKAGVDARDAAASGSSPHNDQITETVAGDSVAKVRQVVPGAEGRIASAEAAAARSVVVAKFNRLFLFSFPPESNRESLAVMKSYAGLRGRHDLAAEIEAVLQAGWKGDF